MWLYRVLGSLSYEDLATKIFVYTKKNAGPSLVSTKKNINKADWFSNCGSGIKKLWERWKWKKQIKK